MKNPTRLLLFLLSWAALASQLCLAQSSITLSSSYSTASIGQPFSTTLVPSGGMAPYSQVIASGLLPDGLTLSPSGVLSGTPQIAGQFTFTVLTTDAIKVSGLTNLALRVNNASNLVINTTSLPNAMIGTSFNLSLSASGGANPYSWDLVLGGGSLPNGLSLTSSGQLVGAPTQAGLFPILLRVTDASGNSFRSALTLRVGAAMLSITTSSLAGALGNVPYTQSLSAVGGAAPYTFELLSGNLPTGLTLNSAGQISGTPTSAGTYNFFARVSDSAGATAQASYSIVVSSSGPRIIVSSLPSAVLNQPFNGALVAQGGTAPYNFTLLSGTIPQGLTLSSTGALSGTPVASGVFPVTVRLTDATGQTTQTDLLINVNSSSFTISPVTNPDGFVGSPYSRVLSFTGGSSPVSYSLLSGSLPPGVSFGPSGTLTGTPTSAGNYQFVVRATDGSGQTAQLPFTVIIQTSNLSLSSSLFANARLNQSYSSTLAASNGVAPYSFTLVSGILPPGLTLSNNGNLSGTPTVSGVFLPVIRVTDANQASSQITVPIVVGSTGLTASNLTLAAARINQTYSATLQATGGSSPYTFQLESGSLPSGLTLSPSGLLSGSPTSSGASNFAVRITDGSGASSIINYAFQTNASALLITSNALASGRLGASYSSTFTSAGGTSNTAYSVEGGSLPPGLTLSQGGILSGTPTAAGTYIFNLRATDGNSQASIFPQVLTISISELSFGLMQFPNIVVGNPYQANFSGVGGTAPYTYSVVTGSLPPGIFISPNGQISGTATASGSYPLTIRITDSTGATATSTTTLTVGTGSSLTITSAALPTARTGQPYSSLIFASGGREPYTFVLSSGSTLPAGLSLSSSGVLSGTPTADSIGNFVVFVTDSFGITAQRTFSLSVNNNGLNIANESLPSGRIGVAYNTSLVPAGGNPVYTFVVSSGILPPGLSLSGAGTISGTPTAAGFYPIVFRLGDASGLEVQKNYTIQIGSNAIVFTNTAQPSLFIGQNYRTSLQATGGVAPYTFNVINGTLPPGLTLSDAGVISGTPSTPGQSTVTIRVVDATGASSTNTLTFASSQTLLNFAFNNLPIATVGQQFSFTPSATGGTGPYTYAVVGALPSGFTISPTGVITGSPAQIGTFFIQLRATDISGRTVESTFPLTVNAVGLRITTNALSPIFLTQAFNQTLATSGATGAVTFNVQSGTLPIGVTLSTAGVLSGTPTVPGTYNFTIRAVDASGASTTSTYTVNVTSAVVNFTTSTLPSALIGEIYNQPLVVSGGSGPYSFSVSSGALPAGLTLSPGGVISGSPMASGNFSFTVRSTDALGQSNTSEFLIGVGTVGSPRIAAVVSAANYAANGVSPGEIVTIFGSNIGPASLVSFTVVNNMVGTTLSNTRVLFDGVAAPIIYTSQNQIATVVPFAVAGRSAVTITIESLGATSAALRVPVRAFKPALFTIDASGSGPAAILNQNASVNSAANAADQQSVISLFLTGLGQTNPASIDGQIVSTSANIVAPVSVTVNGQAAEVQYAGNAPSLVPGVNQINVRLPQSTITGANAIQVTVGNALTGAAVTTGTVTVFVR